MPIATTSNVAFDKGRLAVSKTSLFATSLIGALPGAFLAYLCVMAFLNYAGGGSILLKVVTGLLLVVGLAMPVLSVAALMSGRGDRSGPSAAKAKKDKKKSKQSSKDEAEEDQPASGESSAAVTAEIANTGEVEEFALDDDFDDFADEEEAEPKKKKKK